MWIDTHCHLYCPDFDADLPQTLSRAQEAGVEKIIVPAEDLETSRTVSGLCLSHPGLLYAAVGVHPQKALRPDAVLLDGLSAQLTLPHVVAVGEIGLDYYRQSTPHDVQQSCFRAQLELAAALRKPVIIHNRTSDADMLSILSGCAAKLCGGVFHCFSGDADLARRVLDLGFHISFAGQLTYPSAQPLRDALRCVPLDRLLLETDAPYLSPQQFRGKRNEPAHMVFTAQRAAQELGLPLEEVAAACTRNAKELFGLE